MDCFVSVMLRDRSLTGFNRMLDFVRSYGGTVFETESEIITFSFDDVNAAAKVLHSLTKNFEKSSGGISQFAGLSKGFAKIAQPGEILLAEEIIPPLMDWIEITSMGMLSMDGMKTQLLVYSIDTLKKDYELKPKNRFPVIPRETELRQLDAIMSNVLAGKTNLVEIFGPEGIGKTNLLNQFRDRYPQVRFITGNCYNFIPHLTFGPFLEILCRMLQIEAGDNAEAVHKKIEQKIKALDVSDIATGFYILAEVFGVGEADGIVSKLSMKMKEGMFNTTIRDLLIRESWDKGLIVVIEDIDHIDTASMNLFRALVGNIHDEKILFVVTSEFRPRIKDDGHALEVLPLKREEEDFLFRQFIAEEINVSSTTPLHLYQYLRLYEETNATSLYKVFADEAVPPAGPLPFSDLAWIIDRRIALLDAPEQDTLQQACLLGMEINVELVSALSGGKEFFPTLEKAVELGFLERKYGHYRFSHAVIHRRFYEMVENKKSAHNKLAQFFQKLTGYEEHIAFHLLQAEEIDKAVPALQNCARAVRQRNGWPNAVEYLNQAMELVRSKTDQGKEVDLNLVISLYEELGDLYREMGDEDQALRYYKLVLDGYKDILK